MRNRIVPLCEFAVSHIGQGYAKQEFALWREFMPRDDELLAPCREGDDARALNNSKRTESTQRNLTRGFLEIGGCFVLLYT